MPRKLGEGKRADRPGERCCDALVDRAWRGCLRCGRFEHFERQGIGALREFERDGGHGGVTRSRALVGHLQQRRGRSIAYQRHLPAEVIDGQREIQVLGALHFHPAHDDAHHRAALGQHRTATASGRACLK